MKPGRSLSILLIIMLILSGCGRKEKISYDQIERISRLNTHAISCKLQASGFKLRATSFKDERKREYEGSEYVKPILNNSLTVAGTNHEIRVRLDRNPVQEALRKYGKTSGEAFFTATWDNDLFDYTDHYYTNGAGFELIHPAIGSSPIARILPGLHYSNNYYGLTLVQNMFTPLKLNKTEILVGDRPFASYLVMGHQRTSLSPEKNQRLFSELILGVIGPGSFGNISQDMIHNETPVGWMYQVENDFIANYDILFDQGLYSKNGIEIAAVAAIQAGTLYDNISAGFYFQAGRANDRYNSVFQTTGPQKPFGKRIRYYFSLEMMNRMVFYDATLQGGMFNKESIYTINNKDIERYVFSGSAGFGLSLGKYSLELTQVFLSPEFEGGRKHLWIRIKNIVRID